MLSSAMTTDFRVRNVHVLGADACRLGQHLLQIALAKGEAAEFGKRRLLLEEFLDCADFGHAVAACTMLAGASVNRRKPFGKGDLAMPAATISWTIANARTMSLV